MFPLQNQVPPFHLEQCASLFKRPLQIWDLIYEVGIQELAFVWQSVKNFIRYLWNPQIYNLNPQKPFVDETGKAKIILALHGQGGGPFCFLPLAARLQAADIPNVYTLSFTPTSKDPIPLRQLEERMDEISALCLLEGAEGVEFCLVGHSLGAILASKYIWRKSGHCVTLFISIAGRLRAEGCRFSWFFQKIRSEIERNYQAYLADPGRVPLYTCRGEQDPLVPRSSAHIQELQERQFTVEGFGHGSVLHSPQLHEMIIAWLCEWGEARSAGAEALG